ncbi:ABC transporter ATP-binding protein [Gemmatimonas sp.]|jgi:lipoprotein-releasing system ATP-binding protein|uniref:ABC transporter ATP-binding protein n=1 Tax=Gemmatimonas sp. TaxID=1962908 RepID=UPI0037BF8A8A
MADTEHLVQLEQVTKSYGVGTLSAHEVLHGITLTITRGEFVALIGPSGSGKSTLLHIIGLLDHPTSGTLRVAGEDVAHMTDAELTELRSERLGFVFQQSLLLSAFSAVENVMLPMLLHQHYPDTAMRERARGLLSSVALDRWADFPARNLSGGQQQRVAIARAMAMSPALILADEPTGNLDTVAADGVFQLMRTMNTDHGTSFLIVTHNAALAQRCDRILNVVDGVLVPSSHGRAPR